MPASPSLKRLPKAELHNHLEGTATPELVKRLAQRRGLELPADLLTEDGKFAWKDFLHFLKVYDAASAVIRAPEDYRDVTYDYLRRCAEEGAIYVETMSSPDHAAMAGMSYQDHLDGIVQGIEDAKRDFGVEARIIVTCVRHFGVARAEDVAKAVVAHPHPLVAGFGMGGDEAGFPPAQFRRAFEIAAEAGLGCTTHAGEWGGPDSIREAIGNLPVTRLGHGVRAIEDAALVQELAERRIALEVCPTSNVALKLYDGYGAHPFPKLRAAGCLVSLNSDDPPYFDATVGGEYEIAQREFGMSDAELLDVTRDALKAAFLDEPTRAALLAKVDGWAG